MGIDLTSVLAPNSDFTRWAKTQNLPCCTFVAAAIAEARWGAPMERSVAAYSRLPGNLQWWRDMNVWDGERPWSAVDRARDSVSSTGFSRFDTRVKDLAPPLDDGWTLVQRWRGLDGQETQSPDDDSFVNGASGHTYLVFKSGTSVRVVQSSVSKGYRDSTGTWTGSAGLDGYSVGITHLTRE